MLRHQRHFGLVPTPGSVPETDRQVERFGPVAAVEEVRSQDLELGSHGEGQGDGQTVFIPRFQGTEFHAFWLRQHSCKN